MGIKGAEKVGSGRDRIAPPIQIGIGSPLPYREGSDRPFHTERDRIAPPITHHHPPRSRTARTCARGLSCSMLRREWSAGSTASRGSSGRAQMASSASTPPTCVGETERRKKVVYG